MTVVAVTGANGFIGRVLCDRLTKQGCQVRKILRRKSDDDSSCQERYYTQNFEEQTLASFLTGVDVVVHLAARTHKVGEGNDAYDLYYQTNVEGTRNVAKACHAAGVRRCVFVSSVKACGERGPVSSGQSGGSELAVWDEGCLPAPEDSYGRTKLLAEQTLVEVLKGSSTTYTILRPPLVYGPGVEANFKRLMALVAGGYPLPIGRLENKRSLVYVENFADAIIKSMNHEAAKDQVFFVADATLSTVQLVRSLARALKTEVKLIPLPRWVYQICLKLPVIRHTAEKIMGSLPVSAKKLEASLDWTPPVSTEVAMRRTVQSYIEHGR